MRFSIVCGVMITAACGSSPEQSKPESKQVDDWLKDVQKRAEEDRQQRQKDLDDNFKTIPKAPDLPADPLATGPSQQSRPTPTRPVPPQKKPGACVESGTLQKVATKGNKLLMCLDTNADDTIDECAVWDRASGKLLSIDPTFNVEADPSNPDAEPPPEPIDPDEEDPRVTLDSNTVHACPEDRLCVSFMPKITDDETIDVTRGDAKHRSVALAISNPENKLSRIEVWSLTAGRMTARTKFPNLDPDATYTYDVKSRGDAFIAIATKDTESMMMLLGLDGSKRAMLGNGSKFLDAEQLIELTPARFAVVDLGEVDKPYTVFAHDLSGGVAGRWTIALEGDNNDDVHLTKIDPNTLGFVQFGTRVRLDVLRIGGAGPRTYYVPGC